jgi:hypothetical protein
MVLKLLAGALVVLVAAAILLSPGSTERVWDLFGQAKAWFDGVLGSGSGAGHASKPLSIEMQPNLPFLLKPEAPVNLTSQGLDIRGFSGEIIVYPENITLSEAGSGLSLGLTSGASIEGLRLGSLSSSDSGFFIGPNITATSGNLTITGFYGRCNITGGSISLEGNVTGLKANIGGVALEI